MRRIPTLPIWLYNLPYYAKTSIDGLLPPYINQMLPLDKNQYKWEPIRVFAVQTLIDSENNGSERK